MQLTPGEGHDRLRRVDSNRKSRSFSKQPSTGDYYKNLSNDSAEPRGSRGMAPNEEVTRPPCWVWRQRNLSVAALCFLRVLTQVCDICEESDRSSCSTVSCSHAGRMASRRCHISSPSPHANSSFPWRLASTPCFVSSPGPAARTSDSSLPFGLVLLVCGAIVRG